MRKIELRSEKGLDRRLCKEVLKLGGIAIKYPTIHTTGFPDRIVIMPGGRTYYVEMKSTGKQPSPTQKVWIKRLLNLDHDVRVVSTSEMLSEFLKHIAK